MKKAKESWLRSSKDSKINVKNTWENTHIDNFKDIKSFKENDSYLFEERRRRSMVDRRDGGNYNFQKASVALDLCVKTYSTRVDDVSENAYKLLNQLTPEEENREVGGKVIKRIRESNFIARNVTSINMPLDTTESFYDPIFQSILCKSDEFFLINEVEMTGSGQLLFNDIKSKNFVLLKEDKQNNIKKNLNLIENEDKQNNTNKDLNLIEEEEEEDFSLVEDDILNLFTLEIKNLPVCINLLNPTGGSSEIRYESRIKTDKIKRSVNIEYNNTVDNNTVDNNTVDNNTEDNNTEDNNTVDNNTVDNNISFNNTVDNNISFNNQEDEIKMNIINESIHKQDEPIFNANAGFNFEFDDEEEDEKLILSNHIEEKEEEEMEVEEEVENDKSYRFGPKYWKIRIKPKREVKKLVKKNIIKNKNVQKGYKINFNNEIGNLLEGDFSGSRLSKKEMAKYNSNINTLPEDFHFVRNDLYKLNIDRSKRFYRNNKNNRNNRNKVKQNEEDLAREEMVDPISIGDVSFNNNNNSVGESFISEINNNNNSMENNNNNNSIDINNNNNNSIENNNSMENNNYGYTPIKCLSAKPKKVDILKLKNNILNELKTSKSLFSDVIKSLPSKYDEEEATEINKHVCFISLLHICNENELTLINKKKDIIIAK